MVTRDEYLQFARPRYGTANPEPIDNPLWQVVISSGDTAYQVRMNYQDPEGGPGRGTALSEYREQEWGPVWTWERFGRTTTRLPDGRQIHIGGEHEDWYDIDFCIYNDLVVEHPDGRFEIFGYPKDVFPPTDFHTSVLVDRRIWIIGNLGYRDLRRPGQTQVFTLDTDTYSISPVEVGGDGPGWIHRHWAQLTGEGEIILGGGHRSEVSDAGEQISVPNVDCFALRVEDGTWSRITEAGTRLMGISLDDYKRYKAPRLGAANPERIVNPFWTEMFERQLSPRIAREIFADPGTPSSENEGDSPGVVQRPIEDVVWTALREDSVALPLDDGQSLTVGGSVMNFGSDQIDNWIYSDAILVHADGMAEFLLYPPDLFPAMRGLALTRHEGRIFFSGTPDRTLASDWPKFRSIVFELDPETLALRRIGSHDNTPEDIIIGPGVSKPEAPGSLVFPLIRRKREDPARLAILDLESETWSTRLTV